MLYDMHFKIIIYNSTFLHTWCDVIKESHFSHCDTTLSVPLPVFHISSYVSDDNVQQRGLSTLLMNLFSLSQLNCNLHTATKLT